MKLLPSFFSCVLSKVKLFVFAMNSKRRYSFFVCFIAFVKERVHNAVEIDILGIFGRVFIVTNLAAPPKNSSGANSSSANDVIAIDHVLCLSHVFLHVSACLFVEFDLLRSYNYSSMIQWRKSAHRRKNLKRSPKCRQS